MGVGDMYMVCMRGSNATVCCQPSKGTYEGNRRAGASPGAESSEQLLAPFANTC